MEAEPPPTRANNTAHTHMWYSHTQKLSNHYPDVIFVKFYGNSSDETKEMFKNRLKARVTPTFYFFREGVYSLLCAFLQ